MKWLALVVLLIACEPKPRIGDATVYQRIESTTDCAALQREFDTAMTNVERLPAGDERRKVPMSYAEAADKRMEALHCYK